MLASRSRSVVANSLDAARDAAAAVEVDYEPLEAAVSARAAAKNDAPCIADKGNVVAQYILGNLNDVEQIFATAPVITRLRVRNNRLTAAPMEPRVTIAVWHSDHDTYTLYTSSQAPHLARKLLASEVLKIAEERLRVVVPRIGGGFGVRASPYREDAVLLVASRRSKRPVRWRAERSELFVSDMHARDHDTDIAAAFDNSGQILALRTETFADLGAYPSYFGIPIATTTGNRIADGPYRIPVTALLVHCVLTNTVPTGPYRGAGRPEVVHRIERLMDKAAGELGLGVVEIRRRNLVAGADMPYRNSAGQLYDSGNYPETSRRGATSFRLGQLFGSSGEISSRRPFAWARHLLPHRYDQRSAAA